VLGFANLRDGLKRITATVMPENSQWSAVCVITGMPFSVEVIGVIFT
jgi:hypothetical protein